MKRHKHTSDPRKRDYDPDRDPMLGCVECERAFREEEKKAKTAQSRQEDAR